jgi:peptidyl-prolyl cis-trans isomerase D
VGQDGQVPDLGSMSGPGAAAFTLAKGQISGPINAGQTGVVLTVTDKQEPTADDIAKNFDQTREQLLDAQREEIYNVCLPGDGFAEVPGRRRDTADERQATAPGGIPGS